MFTIPIQVTGDAWNNRTQVKELLDQTHPGQSVILDLFSEGPSLQKLGVVDLVDQYNLNVYVTRWCNGVENVSYYKNKCNSQSHFFPMAQHYWIDSIENKPTTEYRFGVFLGRNTYSRNRILYDAAHCWPDYFLLSKIPNLYSDNWTVNQYMTLETADAWFDNVENAQQWFSANPIPSLDKQIVQNYFTLPELSPAQMTTSLLNHYPRFNVELICESYTLGDAFFPTEKTVRPIVGNKPFIVYGPKNYLNNLREQEGFQTFNSIWNEDYDQLEGVPRWQAISQLIDSLILQGKEQWADTIQQASVITQHNRKILEKIINDRKKL
jgi:hypothetical protein